MLRWKRLSKTKKTSLVLSVFENGEELTATEILQRLRDKGVDISLTPAGLGSWLRLHMEFKYLQKVRKPDPENWYNAGHNRTFWKLI